MHSRTRHYFDDYVLNLRSAAYLQKMLAGTHTIVQRLVHRRLTRFRDTAHTHTHTIG